MSTIKTLFDRLTATLRTIGWLAARQAIAATLPDKQSKSYNYLTADIHCRIVGRLEWLVPFEELIY